MKVRIILTHQMCKKVVIDAIEGEFSQRQTLNNLVIKSH